MGKRRAPAARPVMWHGAVVTAAAVCALALGVAASTTAFAHHTGDTVVGHGCYEFMAYPEVAYDKAQALVSDPAFEVRSTPFTQSDSPPPSETAKLWITVRRCERLDIDGHVEENVIESYLAVPVRRPEFTPRESGTGLLDADTLRFPEDGRLDNYLVQWITTSKRRAQWLRQHADLAEDQVLVIDDLVFDYHPVPAAASGGVDENFTASVPAPAPSPFTINARVTEPAGQLLDAHQNQWWHTGSVIYADATGAFGTGDGTIRSDDPDSPLGQAFGGDPDDQTRPTNLECHVGTCVPEPASFASYHEGSWTTRCFHGHDWGVCP